MKVLWIVNTIFPAPSINLGLAPPVVGGWMYGLAEQMSKSTGIKLSVATTYNGNELRALEIDGISYFLLPCKNTLKYDSKLEQYWTTVCEEFQPDVVHIHGTEYVHGLACMRKFPDLKYIVSIQGLVGVYSRYYYSGMSTWDILKNITFRDLVRLDTVFQQKAKFKKRGAIENEYIKRTKNVIGRTHWDFAHTKAANSSVHYHFCNESLRDSFYSASKWSLQKCDLHTVFLSQAGYPIKGLHQVIKSLVALKTEYPDIKIRVAGVNITKNETIAEKIKRTGYGKYISELLKKHKLEDSLIFLGSLSEKNMIEEYQKAHVFICPSSIENSPNSLGEAQLLGTPLIASYVGGVPDMVVDGDTGLLYRFEEIEMLSEKIRCVFNDNGLAGKISINGIDAAGIRHNRKDNLVKVLHIYSDILTN